MMGDLSSEPSMEDILSSIKRIIAEEGEATPGRGRRAGRAAPPLPGDDEVLELSNPMPQSPMPQSMPRSQSIPQQRPADAIRAESARPIERTIPAEQQPVADIAATTEVVAEPDRRPEQTASIKAARASESDVAADDPIVSARTVEATRGTLDQLSRLLVKPEPRADGTLEGLVRDMLRPMLRDWLDAQLPTLVEEMVAREIDKIMSSRR